MPVDTNAANIINGLKDEANSILTAALGSTPLEAFAIGSQGNFFYNWQDATNVTLFNQNSYSWISSDLKAGASPIQLDASFTNLYLQAITAISYSLSTADQAKLNKGAAAATQQAAAVQNAWLQAFGKFPGNDPNPINDIAGEIAAKWASPPTTLDAIENAADLDGLLNKRPAAAGSILPVFTDWLNAMSSVLSLQNSVSLNNFYLRRARNAVQTPTSANGGLLLNNNTTVPAYKVTAQVSDIQNALNSGTPEVKLSMTVSRSTADEFKVTVSGGTGFSIPILDFLTIGVTANASYFSDNIATTDNSTTVDMTFPGVNLVTFGPAQYQMAGNGQYWFWMQPIRDAIANGSSDVSGYKFSPVPGTDFSENGPFAYLMGVAISSYPTITITTKSANYQSIQQTFEQSASTTVSFLGIDLASASESTYSNHVTVDASSSTVTITLSPPPDLVAGTSNAAQAWVLGVQPCYPATTSAAAMMLA